MTGVTLRPLTNADHALVAHLAVAPAQRAFAATVAEVFDNPDPALDIHAILSDGVPVGLFRIDRAFRRLVRQARPGELGVRSMMIDRPQQGRGLGTAAVRALPAYLVRTYPGAPSVALAVHHANPAARAAYLAGGFEDSGEDWLPGGADPRDILRLVLVSATRKEPA